MDLNLTPTLPHRKNVRIGVLGSGFIVNDCHLVSYRKTGLNPVVIASRTRANAAKAAVQQAKTKRLQFHLVLADSSPKEVARLKDGKVHGDLPPGRGVVKFAPYLQAIKELKIDGAVSIELEYSPDPKRIVEWVEEAYRETARLMDGVGLRS
jgi:hypothetical protein